MAVARAEVDHPRWWPCKRDSHQNMQMLYPGRTLSVNVFGAT